MNEVEIIQKASYLYAPEVPEDRSKRMDIITEGLMMIKNGNIVEIGAGEGMSTKSFLKNTWAVGREVLVIDPWESEPNQPKGYGQYSYRNFIQHINGYTNLTVCQTPSHDKRVPSYMAQMVPIRFAFVDGLQLKFNVLSDLFLCSAHGVDVICVDDYNRNTEISQVPEAVDKFIQGSNKYRMIETRKENIECYLIKLY